MCPASRLHLIGPTLTRRENHFLQALHIAIALACLLVRPAGAVELIAHGKLPDAELSYSMARAIFGMRQTEWPSGVTVRVFVLPDNHAMHRALCKERLNMYPYQLRQVWERQTFTGIGQAPIEVANEEEMLARVLETPGSIGYLEKAPAHAKIKAIQIR
jgi:hypothetical protein